MSDQSNPLMNEVGDHGLKKHKLKTSTVVFMIFCLVSAGCYGIEEIVPACGPGLTIVLLCVIPFLWGLPFGLVVSELGSARPQEGGYYKWVQEALGEFWGFQAGWWRTMSTYIDNTLYVILAGGYAAGVLDLSTIQEFLFKAVMIIVFVYINIRGVKDVGIASSIFAIIILVTFALVSICGFMNWGEGNNISFQMTAYEPSGMADWFYLIAGGISIGIWIYSGYESMSTVAGEIEDPQVIPKGTMISIPLIMAVYIVPTIAGLGSVGEWERWSPDDVGYGTVFREFWGVGMSMFFTITAILAMCSIYNTYIASGSRGFFALSDDNLAPPIFTKCDKKYGVPYIAVLSIGITNLVLCMLPFGFIIVLDVSVFIAAYLLVYISAYKLRDKIPKDEYKFKIPGSKKVLLAIIIPPILLAIFSFLINGSDYYVGGMVALLSGPIMYFIWRRRYGGLTAKNPKLFPSNKKTGMAVGDTKRISLMLLISTILNIAACAFMPWYEYWGDAEYGWASTDYFDGIMPNVNVDTIVGSIQIALYIITAVCAIGCVVFYIISKKVEQDNKSAYEKMEKTE